MKFLLDLTNVNEQVVDADGNDDHEIAEKHCAKGHLTHWLVHPSLPYSPFCHLDCSLLQFPVCKSRHHNQVCYQCSKPYKCLRSLYSAFGGEVKRMIEWLRTHRDRKHAVTRRRCHASKGGGTRGPFIKYRPFTIVRVQCYAPHLFNHIVTYSYIWYPIKILHGIRYIDHIVLTPSLPKEQPQRHHSCQQKYYINSLISHPLAYCTNLPLPCAF